MDKKKLTQKKIEEIKKIELQLHLDSSILDTVIIEDEDIEEDQDVKDMKRKRKQFEELL